MDGDRPSVPSLEALGEGRRIASYLGATLGAVLPCATPPRYHEDDAIAVLSRHGADKVVLSPGPDLGLPTLHATHGHTLAAATDRMPPALLILAATPGGRAWAPRTSPSRRWSTDRAAIWCSRAACTGGRTGGGSPPTSASGRSW